MFRKLLKYDVRALWKIWLICMGTSLLFAIVCGLLFGQSIPAFDTVLEDTVDSVETNISSVIAAEIFIVLGVLSFYGVILSTTVFSIFLLYRFYADLYSDIGYLTFTIPVPRKTILLEKICNFVTWGIGTTIVLLLDLRIITFFIPTFPDEVNEAVSEVTTAVSAYLGGAVWLYGLETFLFLILSMILSALLAYFCITFGAVIAKKHKLLASIGIYYGFSIVLGIAISIFLSIATIGFADGLPVISNLTAANVKSLLGLGLFGGCILCGALDVLLYHMTLSKMENKLNLP